ncbi:MAG: hypothetical protein Q9219_007063, partial [cf. Caloplaca sp. 3 TL-2023]
MTVPKPSTVANTKASNKDLHADWRAGDSQQETVVPSPSQWTSFPSLTGYKPCVSKEDLTRETYHSRLTLSDLHEAAHRYQASPAAALQAAWAKLLRAYTAAGGEIIFPSITPRESDSSGLCSISLVSCSFNFEEKGQAPFGCVIRCFRGQGKLLEQRLSEPSQAQDHQESRTILLDLENLLLLPPDREASNNGPHFHTECAVAGCLKVFPSTSGPLCLTVSAPANLLNSDAAQLMLAQYDRLLQSVIAGFAQSLDGLCTQLSPSLLSISNPEPTVLRSFSSLPSQFEHFAKHEPHRIALEFWTREETQLLQSHVVWTYAELNDRAETLACELQRRCGALADHVVPICMERCPEIYVSVLAILKSGAAWCPIDPTFPPRRRHDLIARADARLLIVNDAPENYSGVPGNVTAVDVARIDWGSRGRVEEASIASDSLAYLIWTSGTTGPPKGVPVSHQAAVASMRAVQDCIPANVKQGNVRCLQFSQSTFDVFVQDLFYTWGVGGTLISADHNTVLGSFSELATAAAATHAHLTPAFAASVPRKSCPTLEVVTMIGEKLTQEVADDWSQRCRLYNTYGPAEATVVSTSRLVSHDDIVQSANIGLPLPSVTAVVMQDDGIVMKNGIGELALGGPQLCRGYWHDLEKTETRFVWNARLRTVLYRTGDTVRQLYDGSLEFIGRTDDLIKVQGIRIELSEISFALRSSHPSVRQAEVLYLERPDRPFKVIVAFLAAPTLTASRYGIIENDQAVQVAQRALDKARSQLPSYMIPKAFVVVAAIPRTSSAKVDRAAMKQYYANLDIGSWEGKLRSASCDGRTATDLSPHETTIVQIIAELTGISDSAISRQSTLPSIGVDSITAVRLVPRLGARDIVVSITEILGCATLEDLFICSCKREEKGLRGAVDLSRFHHDYVGSLPSELGSQVELVLPILPLQESLLYESFRNSNSYWSHSFFALDHDIDLPRLEQAWKHVAQATDALRTAFCPVADLSGAPPINMTFLQLIYREIRVDWAIYPPHSIDFETQARNRAQEIAEQHRKRHMVEPLWAVTILRSESGTVMMVSLHHAVRDELSLHVLLEDLESAYMNRDKPFRQRGQLRDAVSLLHTADPEQTEQDEQFWATCLSPFNDEEESNSWPVLKLSKQESGLGAVAYTWNVDGSYSDLRARAANAGATSVVAILRVVWACILLEYLETDNVVFGETRSARGEATALSDAVAPLVFVIPTPFRAQSTLREMLRAHVQFQMQSKAHYGVHPRQIRKVLRRSGMEPLYPAIFNFVPDATGQRRDGASSLWRRIDDVIGLTVEHTIALNAFVSEDDSIQFELSAAKQSIDRDHLRVIARQIDALLQGVLANPDMLFTHVSSQMPGGLISLSPTDGRSNTNLARAQSPTEWVDHYAAVHPEWSAAEVANTLDQNTGTTETWTYRQLQRSYRSIAAIIQGCGYTKRMIAVCLDRRLDVYAVVLAIMSTGNTYLPVADDLPNERKLFLLRDSDAAMLFTSRQLPSEISSSCQTIFVDDLDYSEPVGLTTAVLPPPTDGAYLLYTSGSTGSPKGVLVSRGNLMSFIEAVSHFVCSYVDMVPLQGTGKWLGMASYAFDVHLLEMFFAWRHGMATVTAPRSMLLDNLELALQELKVTHASFVPSLVDNAGLDPKNLPHLRYMSLGGEMISQKAVDTWSRSHVVLANAYGPTEATIGCCFSKVTPGSNVRNIGSPLSYTVAHVLRPGTTEYVLRGTSGELCLTGDLVAAGYHKRPDAKGFVEDFEGEKLYRTGDRVRLMADGSLEFLGRDDDQTKIRGQRIELGEVSEVVRAAVQVVLGVDLVEVTSLVVEHGALSRPQLVSFVAAHTDSRNVFNKSPGVTSFASDQTRAKIRAHCCNVLPSFMVPQQLIRLTSLPLVPTSRKVDAKQLRAIFTGIPLDGLLSSREPASLGTAVMSDAEKLVQSVAAESLAVDQTRIDAGSNLFQFGLDSLNTISLSVRLQKAGFANNVHEILKNPTVRAIAAPSNGEREDGVTNVTVPADDLENRFRASNKDDPILSNVASIRPCLPMQETLVAGSSSHEGKALYVNHVILRLSPKTDHGRLIQAWKSTAEDNDILRSCFRSFEHGFIQLVLRDSPLSFDHIRSTAVDGELLLLQQRESEIATDIIASIEMKPPIRLTLAASHSASQKGMLLVSIHHALYDAESFSMILDEVYARYQNTTSPVSRTPITALIDYVARQSQENSRGFWTRYLDGYKSKQIHLEIADDQSRSTSRDWTMSLTEVQRLAASLNSTPASLVQALFGVVLTEILRTNDVVFGSILSGRTIPIEGAHTILAPCITTIPQRVRLDHSSNLQDIIQSAQRGFMNSFEYQHTPLRAIHRWLEADGPLFDSLFTYTSHRGMGRWSDLWCEISNFMSSGFPLAIEMVADQSADKVVARCDYTTAFGTVEKADSLLERLENLSRLLMRGERIPLENIRPKGSAVHRPKGIRGSRWTEEEIIMKDIILNMSAVQSVDLGRETSFFALGIDSITAIQFAKRLRQHGIQCSSADVIRYSCIGNLAQHIKSTRTLNVPTKQFKKPTQLPEISWESPPSDLLKIYPCTPLQSSMLTQTLGSDDSVYVHHHAIRFSAGYSALSLKAAWAKMVAATEILRTSFHFSEGAKVWLAAVHEQPSGAWNESRSDISIEQVLSEIKESFVFRRASDFGKPPWTVNLVGDAFVLSLHHSLYDGESIRILFHDLVDLLRGRFPPTRPPFSRAAEEIDQNNDKAENYWTHSLCDYRSDLMGPSVGTRREARVTMEAGFTDVLEGCRGLGVTLQSLAMLAFGKTLAWSLRRSDVVFGRVVRGRNLSVSEADEVVGPLFNTVPMRIHLGGSTASNREFIQGLQRLVGDSQAYQHAALNKIQQAWRKSIGAPDADLVHALFVFQKRIDTEDGQPWSTLAINSESASTEYSTNFECEHGDTGINLCLNSSTIQDLDAFLRTFEYLLSNTYQCPDDPATAAVDNLLAQNDDEVGEASPLLQRDQSVLDRTAGGTLDTVRRLLAEVSGVALENITNNASIFSLGLDSISAIQIAATARKQSLSLSVADVLQGRTVNGICQRLQHTQNGEGANSKPTRDKLTPNPLSPRIPRHVELKAIALVGLREDDVEAVSACLPGQYYHLLTWLQSQRTLGEGFWSYASRQPLDVQRLREAWRTLRERHPLLRTLFVAWSKSEVAQLVLKPTAIRSEAFQVLNITAEGQDVVGQAIRQEGCRHFDLFSPPADLVLIRNRETSHVMLKLHHALYDAWTITTFIRDLSALYEGRHLPTLPSESSLVQRISLLASNPSAQDYWQRSLAGCQKTMLCSAHEAPQMAEHEYFFMKDTVWDLHKLENNCQQYDTSLATLILIAFARTLAQFTQVGNPVFGLYQTGRSINIDDMDKVYLPCLNVTPLMVRKLGINDERTSIKELQSDLSDRVAFEQSKLDDVYNWIGWGQEPLFNTFVNILWAQDPIPDNDGPHSLFTPRAASESIDLISNYRVPGRTAVDDLDTCIIPNKSLFLDVKRCSNEDLLRLVVRCDYEVLCAEEAESFVGQMIREIGVLAGCVEPTD